VSEGEWYLFVMKKRWLQESESPSVFHVELLFVPAERFWVLAKDFFGSKCVMAKKLKVYQSLLETGRS